MAPLRQVLLYFKNFCCTNQANLLFSSVSVLVADVIIYFPAVYWIFAARKTLPGDVHGATNMVCNIGLALHTSDFSCFSKST